MTELREFQDGEVIAGTRYRVLRLIGVGGMGSVYEVEHMELGKRFVLKALLRELARREDLVQRLRNEWRALGRLQHANIVNVTDAGTSGGGVPFYVMERLEGETLAVYLRRKRRLHVLEAVTIASTVLDALSAAHDIGIIHRDVKPANVFIVNGGGVKLLDFGIAKIADATGVVTARGLAVGTPRYMSPEQARGERVDGRSDVYATALILFEMIAGVGPFDDARDANELLLAHLAREAPALSTMVMGVSAELEGILSRMLAKDCRERPLHAREGAEQLRAFTARQHSAPATDAPTAEANYGASARIPIRQQRDPALHDAPTRAEGSASSSRASSPSLTDAALTQPMAPLPGSTQVTLTANSGPAFSLSSVPNTTFVSPPPSFDGSTTLAMAVAPASAPGSLRAPNFPAVERPERTEMLAESSAELAESSAELAESSADGATDAGPTNTRVPLPEVARPISLTPPPVVDTGRSEPPLAPRAQRLGRWALIAAATVSAVFIAGFVARGGNSTLSSTQTEVAARPPALSLPASPQPAEPAHAAPAAAPISAASAEPAATTGSLPSAASDLSPPGAGVPNPAVPAVPSAMPDLKRLSAASLAARPRFAVPARGPFLRALPANKPIAPPSAPPQRPAMPASGL